MNNELILDLIEELAGEATSTMADYLQLKYELEQMLEENWGLVLPEEEF